MSDSTAQYPSFPIVDAHLDIAYNAVVLERDLTCPVSEIRDDERTHPPADPKAGVCMVSWPALVAGQVAVVGGSIFVEPLSKSHPQSLPTYRSPEEAHAQAVQQLDYYRRVSEEREDVALITDEGALDDVLTSWGSEHPQVGVFMVMEGADPIRDPGELHWWIERGLRGVGLSWSAGTRYAGGNAHPGPLTDEGEALLHVMADANLLLDISHLWEEAVYQVLDRYPGPIVATHANPRFFVDWPRQISDHIIRGLADRDGVVGVVAFNRMLDPDWRPGSPRLPLSRLVQAIDHICQVTGDAHHVGLGTDLDGGFGRASAPAELSSVADLHKVATGLGDRGYAESDIEAVMGKNWLRVMRGALEAF